MPCGSWLIFIWHCIDIDVLWVKLVYTNVIFNLHIISHLAYIKFLAYLIIKVFMQASICRAWNTNKSKYFGFELYSSVKRVTNNFKSKSKVYQCDRNCKVTQVYLSLFCFFGLAHVLCANTEGEGFMTSTATSQQSRCCSFSSHVVHLCPQVNGLTYCNGKNKSVIRLRKQHEWDALFTWDVFQTPLPRWPFFPGFVPGVVHSFCFPPVALATPHITACGRFLIMHTLPPCCLSICY